MLSTARVYPFPPYFRLEPLGAVCFLFSSFNENVPKLAVFFKKGVTLEFEDGTGSFSPLKGVAKKLIYCFERITRFGLNGLESVKAPGTKLPPGADYALELSARCS